MKKNKLTKKQIEKRKQSTIDWQLVFKIRCKSKCGGKLTEIELAFCHRAFKEDPERYSELENEVFEATKPFGST